MVNVVLRPYQKALVEGVRFDWQQGAKGAVVVLPTGGGKSVIVSDIVKNEAGAVCVIAHRQELVSQMSVHLARQGVKHRIIAPQPVISSTLTIHRAEFDGRSFYDPAAPVAVAGVDTLCARGNRLGSWLNQVGLVVVDEAHHVLRENKWGKAMMLFPNARYLGVTATPERTDGKGLGRPADGLFDSMQIGPTMRDLINGGSLAEYDIVCPSSLFDTGNLKVGSTGDYTAASMKAETARSQITGDVVQNYLKFAKGKRGVTFLSDVESCVETARRFEAAGVPAMAISANTPDNVRADAIRRFKAGEILQLVNVDILGEGVDVPAVEVISMARPTQSLIVYMQQFGRCLRPKENGARGLVIDHVGNVVRHGLPDIPRSWTLHARAKRGSGQTLSPEFELRSCLECFKPYQRLYSTCPHCGHRPEKREATAPEQVDGDLELLKPEVLEAMRKRATLKSPAHVQQQATFAAGPVAGAAALNRQKERLEAQKALATTISKFAGHERHINNLDDASISRKFFLTFGLDVVSALGGKASEMRELREKIETDIGSRGSSGDSAGGRALVA